MQTKLFEAALNIEPPFFIKDIRFDMERKRLDIWFFSQSWQEPQDIEYRRKRKNCQP